MLKSAVLSLTVSLSVVSALAADPIATSMFGAQDHMLVNSTFFAQYAQWWDPQYTIPVQKKMNGRWVRDGVTAYMDPMRSLVSLPSDNASLKQAVANHRAIVNNYLSQYDRSGFRLIFTIIALAPNVTNYDQYNADFLSMVTQMVKDHPSIYAIELHNEPSSSLSWHGTPEDYVNVYKPFADSAHEVRPEIKVLGGGGSGWWWATDFYTRAFNAGMMNFIDGISIHPYNGANVAPEIDYVYRNYGGDWEQSQTAQWSHFQSFNATDKPLELDFTEFGYASVTGAMDSVPDDMTQAAYLSRLMIQTQDLKVRGIPLNSAEWYDFKDDQPPNLDGTPNIQHNFGLYSYDLSAPKPAFIAYKTFISAFPDNNDIIAAPAGVAASSDRSTKAVATRLWQRKSDGAIVVPYWRLDQVTSVTANFNGYLTVTVPNGSAVSSVVLQQSCGGQTVPKFEIAGNNVKFQVSYKSCASWAVIH